MSAAVLGTLAWARSPPSISTPVRAPVSKTLPLKMFIAGEPMKRATNRLPGCS